MEQWGRLTKILRRELPGKVIDGRWRIGGLLDQGGMGIVFHCFDTTEGESKDYVIKFTGADHGKEAFAALKLKNEYLIPCEDADIYDFKSSSLSQAENLYYVVMPKADRTLQDFMEGQELDASDVAEIIEDVCHGLLYLHTRPVAPLVHRDLKPANILRYSERWVLADWGIMRPGSYEETAYATAFATPKYAPPEYYDQRTGRSVAVKPSWDVYQLGLIMLELLTDTLWDKRDQDLPEDFPDLDDINEEMARICIECLRQKPEQRPIVADVLKSIEQYLKERQQISEHVDSILSTLESLNSMLARNSVELGATVPALQPPESSEIHNQYVFAGDDNDSGFQTDQGHDRSVPQIEITRVGHHLYSLYSHYKRPRIKNEAMKEALNDGYALYESNNGMIRILEYDHDSEIFALWESDDELAREDVMVCDGNIECYCIYRYRMESGTNVGDPIDEMHPGADRLVFGSLHLDSIREDPALSRLWL